MGGRLALIVNGVPVLLLSFGVIDWTAEQLGQYVAFVNTVVAGVGLILGQNAEAKVTPISNPQVNVPLVPATPVVVVGEHEEPPALT